MRRHEDGCLPVVDDGHLVGITTAHDFQEISGLVFEEHLKAQEAKKGAAP